MTKSPGENEGAGNARSKGKSPLRTPKETVDAERGRRTAILECPTCSSHRATVLDCRPRKARCADCGHVYRIKTEKPLGSLAFEAEAPTTQARRQHAPQEVKPAPPINARDFGILTDSINQALAAGPDGLRKAQRDANRIARKFGFAYLEPQWFVATPWLLKWAAGDAETLANASVPQSHRLMFPAKPSNPNIGKQSVTRLRVRAAIRWRSVWLLNYSMTASPAMACRAAKIGEPTLYYHKKNDPDFAQLMETAKAHAIDLLHTRCFQRALEGDIEPIHWQGVVVDYVRKFPERLQIEMLRAHMPATFKTPGQGNINIDTGDKILVMTEELRAKLIALHREEIMDTPTNQEGEDERRREIAEGES
jgi:predicted RNA-binding protein with PUA-like domain